MQTTLDSLDPAILCVAVEEAMRLDFMDLLHARAAVLCLDVLGEGAFALTLSRLVEEIRQNPDRGRFLLMEDLVAPLVLGVYHATQVCDLGMLGGSDGQDGRMGRV